MRQTVVGMMPLILAFNAIKGVLNAVITFVVYKRISGFLHQDGLRLKRGAEKAAKQE